MYMYDGIIAGVVVVTVYFIAMASVGHFFGDLHGIFSAKSAVCLVLGAILGGFISAPLFGMSRELGYAGMGAGIGVMYILFYSGVINALIQRIPQSIRHGFRVAFNILRVVLIVAVIIGVVVGVLHYIGV